MNSCCFTKIIAALMLSGCLLGVNARGSGTNFVIQPPSCTNLAGVTLMLSVIQQQATNYPTLTYRWFKDGALISDDSRFSGTQTDTLLIENTVLDDTGVYTAQVLLYGTELAAPTSQVYLVSAPWVERIRQENTGATLRLVADATGGLLSYQWMWQGQEIPGATSQALVFANPYTDASAGYYSVRVTNLVGEAVSPAPGFLLTKSAPSGTYEGLFYETNRVAHEASGFFQFTLTGTKRAFSGKLHIGKARYSFSGTLSMTHEAAVMIQRKNERPLDFRFQLVTTNSDSRCYGTLSDGIWGALSQGQLVYFNKANPTSLAKNYTLSLVNTNSQADEPNGSGYARVIISSKGKVVVAGYTATGFAFSQTRGLSKSGTFPLYTVVNGGRERTLGFLKVSASSPSISGENIIWTKAAGPDLLYPNGFYVALSAAGSPWPYNSKFTIGFTNGVASFFGGDLFSDAYSVGDLVRVQGRTGLKFAAQSAPEKVLIAINRESGVITGSLLNPATGKVLRLRGVALPQQSKARGYFLSPERSGNFTLVP